MIDIEDIKLMYPLNSKYRVYREIRIIDSGKEIKCYGPYGDFTEKFEGMKDYNSWNEIIELWTPNTRIFARLPIEKEDIKRIIPQENKYIIECCGGIEKIDKPFGYGTSDYWHTFKFKNVNEKYAEKFIKKLIEGKCPPEEFSIGLELMPTKKELSSRNSRKNLELILKTKKFLLKEI